MTTPTGRIAVSEINSEIQMRADQNITLDHELIRRLAGAGGSGTRIEMNWLRGKTRGSAVTVSASGQTVTGTSGRTPSTVYAYANAYVTGPYDSINWEVLELSSMTLGATNGTQLQGSCSVVGFFIGYARVRARVTSGGTTVYSNEVYIYVEYQASGNQ
jgi:hypothetical protein